jgi:hypothetical protein
MAWLGIQPALEFYMARVRGKKKARKASETRLENEFYIDRLNKSQSGGGLKE